MISRRLSDSDYPPPYRQGRKPLSRLTLVVFLCLVFLTIIIPTAIAQAGDPKPCPFWGKSTGLCDLDEITQNIMWWIFVEILLPTILILVGAYFIFMSGGKIVTLFLTGVALIVVALAVAGLIPFV